MFTEKKSLEMSRVKGKIIYTGKNKQVNTIKATFSTGELLKFLTPIENFNLNVTVYHWFSSVELVDELKSSSV